MEKKNYNKPAIKDIKVKLEDIIAASGSFNGGSGGKGVNFGDL
jgi:hypothetical protein